MEMIDSNNLNTYMKKNKKKRPNIIIIRGFR